MLLKCILVEFIFVCWQSDKETWEELSLNCLQWHRIIFSYLKLFMGTAQTLALLSSFLVVQRLLEVGEHRHRTLWLVFISHLLPCEETVSSDGLRLQTRIHLPVYSHFKNLKDCLVNQLTTAPDVYISWDSSRLETAFIFLMNVEEKLVLWCCIIVTESC